MSVVQKRKNIHIKRRIWMGFYSLREMWKNICCGLQTDDNRKIKCNQKSVI